MMFPKNFGLKSEMMEPLPCEYILIKHCQSGLYLDIDCADPAPRANVILWTKNSKDNQIWYFDPTTRTYRSKLNDLCLTIDSEKRNLVCDYVMMNHPNQQWQIADMHIKNPANQYLVPESALRTKVGDMITLGTYNGEEYQFWDVERIGGYAPLMQSINSFWKLPEYRVTQPCNLGVPPSYTAALTFPQFPGNRKSQMQPRSDPFHNIFAGEALHATSVTQRFQDFSFSKVDASVGRSYFMIITEMNGKALDIKGGDKAAGTHVIMYTQNKGKNQQWYVDNKGYIRAAINDMVFHADEAGQSLKMVKFIEDPRHQWKIVGNKIFNGMGMCLDIRGGYSNNGSELCAYQFKNSTNQHWKFQYL